VTRDIHKLTFKVYANIVKMLKNAHHSDMTGSLLFDWWNMHGGIIDVFTVTLFPVFIEDKCY